MSKYLIEFFFSDEREEPVIVLHDAESEKAALLYAELLALKSGMDCRVYMFLRNRNDELYLGDLDGDVISEWGSWNARLWRSTDEASL